MSKLMITGKIRTRTALHIGSGQSSSGADALLRRNAAGEIFIPGSALAGPLRAIATRLAPRLGSKVCKTLQKNPDKTLCSCATCHLFGEFYPQEKNIEEEGGRASRLWVYDAPLVQREDKPPSTWIRDGVGIDRTTRAAARLERVKFDLEVLPAGAEFQLHLELEDASEMDQQLLAITLAEWQGGRGAIGGRVARGLGAFELRALECRECDLNDAVVLMTYLRGKTPVIPEAQKDGKSWLAGWIATARSNLKPAGNNLHVSRSWLDLSFTLQATGPLLVNDPTTAGRSGFDHAPLVENGLPVLPGSSLRGVLRSHAERIARTIATEQAEGGEQFKNKCPACSAVARASSQEDVPLECCDGLLSRLEKGNQRNPLLEVEEDELCLACRLFGSPRLGSRLIVEDALFADKEPVYKVQDFLAIDRFTGGGREGAKFDAVALWRPAFQGRLRLENPRDWELGWLVLLLRDLAEGWLTVGFGRAKGYGRVIIPKWTARIGFVQEGDFPLCEKGSAPLPAGLLKELPQDDAASSLYRVAQLTGVIAEPSRSTEAWVWSLEDGNGADWLQVIGDWVRAFHRAIADLERENAPGRLPPLYRDTYFDGRLERIYKKASRCLEEVAR